MPVLRAPILRERFHHKNDTLAPFGIMILACRARISRGRYFEITEAGNRFAESRFPLFRDASFLTCVCIPVCATCARLLREQQLSNRRYARRPAARTKRRNQFNAAQLSSRVALTMNSHFKGEFNKAACVAARFAFLKLE